MGITLDYAWAKENLQVAVELAKSDRELPTFWSELAADMERAASKTYTPALGTALLARSTNDRVDPLSIKEAFSDASYSIRTLCHQVLVPAAIEHGFSIRNTGREPMNNQPWFRYDHMTEIERVRDPEVLEKLKAGLSRIAGANSQDALLALASFLRYRFQVTAAVAGRKTLPGQLKLAATLSGITEYLADNVERPRKSQALVAACLDLTHADVRSRRLNDPSRDVPGDVQAYDDDSPHTAVEVRAKAVSETEARSFVAACHRAGIGRAVLVIDAPAHTPLSARRLRTWAGSQHEISLSIYESVASFFQEALAWGDRPVGGQLSSFASFGLRRLQEIEASDVSQSKWITLCDSLAAGTDGDDMPEDESDHLW